MTREAISKDARSLQMVNPQSLTFYMNRIKRTGHVALVGSGAGFETDCTRW